MTTDTPVITINVPYSQKSPAHSRTPSMTPRTTPIPSSPTSSRKQTPPRISTPTSATAPLTSWSTSFNPRSCYLCNEQNPGDFSPTTKYLALCLLCSRDFCPIHSRAAAQDAATTANTPIAGDAGETITNPVTTTTVTAVIVEGASPTNPTVVSSTVTNNDANICNINHSQYYHESLEQARDQISRQNTSADTNTNSSSSSDSTLQEAEDQLLKEGIFPSLGERERQLFKTSPVSTARMLEIENFRSLAAELEGTKDARRSWLIETKEVVGADIAV